MEIQEEGDKTIMVATIMIVKVNQTMMMKATMEAIIITIEEIMMITIIMAEEIEEISELLNKIMVEAVMVVAVTEAVMVVAVTVAIMDPLIKLPHF